MPNFNPDTTIPFGVIPLNDLDGEIAGALIDLGCNAAYIARVNEIAENLQRHFDINARDAEQIAGEIADAQNFDDECTGHAIEYAGVKGVLVELQAILFISYNGPVGKGDPCSPCLPGAVNIRRGAGLGADGHGVPDNWWPDADL
jgi:hypothetical protein